MTVFAFVLIAALITFGIVVAINVMCHHTEMDDYDRMHDDLR